MNPTAAPDGSVWMPYYTGPSYTAQVARLDPTGQLHVYSLPSIGASANTGYAGASNVAMGSDGNAWVSQGIGCCVAEKGVIDRVTPDGTVTEFPLPRTGVNVLWMTSAPDGAVWFGEDDSRVGRVDMNGQVTEFPVAMNPYQIVAGPDGALWFLGSTTIVGRVTTSGQVTYLNLPQTPSAVAAGGDGAMWFSAAQPVGPPPSAPGEVQHYDGLFIRVTATGVSRTILVPTPAEFAGKQTVTGTDVSIRGMTLGPDGNLWYTDDNNDAVGVLRADGTVQESPVHTTTTSVFGHGTLTGIVSGPGGRLWTSDIAGDTATRLLELTPG